MATIIIAAIILAYVGFVIVSRFKKIKSGEPGCDCGCSGCSKTKTNSHKRSKAL